MTEKVNTDCLFQIFDDELLESLKLLEQHHVLKMQGASRDDDKKLADMHSTVVSHYAQIQTRLKICNTQLRAVRELMEKIEKQDRRIRRYLEDDN